MHLSPRSLTAPRRNLRYYGSTKSSNSSSPILAHPYKGLRIRYWQEQDKSAWILEEIGKEKPITVGFVVRDGRIQQVKVLVFRESRGWEVRHSFFTDQFKQAGLTGTHELDTRIDNISGATLSVRAVSKLARIALLLDNRVADTGNNSPG